MATINEVSALAQVSISTVSRVINNTAPVKESTRKRVFDAMRELGYQPNLFAQGLVTNRTRNISLVLTDLTSAYFGPLIKTLERTLRTARYNLTVSIENLSYEEMRDTFQSQVSRRSDAVILFPHCLTDEEILTLKEEGPPMVLLNRFLPQLEAQCIVVDNALGSRLAVEHLIQNGHRDIACISGIMQNKEAQDRVSGYRQCLKQHRIRYRSNIVVEGGFSVHGGYEAASRLIAGKQPFSAIFACNDQMAAGAMKALREHRIRVPEDVSLVGFDDVEYAGLLSPALTTVRQPVEEMGRRAAELAISLSEGRPLPSTFEMFAPTLVVRESVAADNR
ncbi:transcriptional regulator [Hahella sp. CCB-MM4]|uniref:LacI family DNA-binding transcriptional regulator n=1 Tax=Hahella sp. (strain CCB-MM4) TaxID=1926491 RepID=UPI000B9BD6BA|nr:LacI family DNA-binding transcriptional regulator [Hahella sp. CCB-MM4]OZG71589.1 transcriptional regulator [Hahella sp. CCB-MM4]